MYILGISAYFHDSAAALIKDGKIVAAAQEERFTRKKHDHTFPVNAIKYCLKHENITVSDIDCITFYDKPLLKFERILETSLAYAPKGLKTFLMAMPLWLKEKLWVASQIRKNIADLEYTGEILFTEHHQSHAASAFYPSPFKKAAFLTLDGVGEWATNSFGVGYDNKIEIQQELNFPHSLGLLYSAFTYFTGFKVNSGEYKVMGLAPYGEPKYVSTIYEHLIDLKDDGSFKLNMEYFDFCAGLKMTSSKFDELFDGPPRVPESELTQREMDLARSVQEVTEEIMLRMARNVKKETGADNLVLAGGVALNCVGNGRLLREGPFENIWIQPAAGDAGGALGSALYAYYHCYDNKRQITKGKDSQSGTYLGPEYSDKHIEQYLDINQIEYQQVQSDELCEIVGGLLADGNILGWFQGRMEFGPRALGARSIIGDPRSTEMQSVMNLKIKYRESFRPFAPSILAEHASEYFQLEADSPYMMFVAPIKEKFRINMTDEQEKLFGIEKLNVPRSTIPAVTHVDYSARIQTVHEDTNPLYYKMIQAFHKQTGCPIVINTSFNVRGEPIVCSPEDAYRCFMRTEMDYLIMGNYIVAKNKQIPLLQDTNWMEEFELD